MVRIFLMVFFIICSLFAKAQKAPGKETRKGLQTSFSVPILTAYQESAQSKILDLYQYLQLLSDTAVSATLKKEIEENIYSLFKSKDVLVPNMFMPNKNAIKLSTFIEEVKNQPLVKFKVIGVENGQIFIDNWQMAYTIEVLNKDVKYQLPVTQTVYLTKEIKAFGSTTKEVWQMHLGEIE